MEESKLDLEAIAKKCNLFDGNTEDVIRNINSLDEIYERDNLVLIYNYFLSVCKNPDVLLNIIRCSDRFRDKSSLSPLLDLLLLKFHDDNESK